METVFQGEEMRLSLTARKGLTASVMAENVAISYQKEYGEGIGPRSLA